MMATTTTGGSEQFPSTSAAFFQAHSNLGHQEVKPKREKRKYRCRKRSPATIERAKMIRRDKANARERRRMNSLNDALEHLRTILPALPDEPKMTKIETLRKAQQYIATLSYQLSCGDPSSSPESMQQYPCDGINCGCCSTSVSLSSTPFQSPCFPPPTNQYSSQSNYNYSNYYSPQFPKP
ncbi:unnamed protein product [Caenorhabditis bovis]|uniref:BHLH domain-containing protein n=1 Tax=Caenorhabditis bovis TaxID=2654633 RepID=A0A8S1FDM6_9PELO|nr:unnamed protein product [Caenorhabditis bovis]